MFVSGVRKKLTKVVEESEKGIRRSLFYSLIFTPHALIAVFTWERGAGRTVFLIAVTAAMLLFCFLAYRWYRLKMETIRDLQELDLLVAFTGSSNGQGKRLVDQKEKHQ